MIQVNVKELLKKQKNSQTNMAIFILFLVIMFYLLSLKYLCLFVISFFREYLFSGVYLLSEALGLLRGGMHMKKRVYVIKLLNRLCIILLITALLLLIIKLDICR